MSQLSAEAEALYLLFEKKFIKYGYSEKARIAHNPDKMLLFRELLIAGLIKKPHFSRMVFELSSEQQEKLESARALYQRFREHYFEFGFLYSGCLAAGQTIPEDRDILIKHSLIERRDCDGYSFELTVLERFNLIIDHKLGRVWKNQSKHHPNSEVQEVVRAMESLEITNLAIGG